MNKIDVKICSKAKNPHNCYKCIARLEELLKIDDLAMDDRDQIHAMFMAFSEQGRTPTEEEVALITQLSNRYLI
ncbi:MAG: hypothetical protein GXP49_03530 [Deltaproteobacteria bacterium]|nr:hypothetical protein [Deltaproteobacteria bacterium]